jgi:hypothetical protein
MITTIVDKRIARSFKKLISDDNTLSIKDKELIFDTIKRICYEPSYNQLKLRLQIHEVSELLKDPKHGQAKRGFKGIVKMNGKRNELARYFSKIKR